MKTSKTMKLNRLALPAMISLIGMGVHASAMAFEINTGDPDIKIRWDQTLRYNAGWRMNDPKWDLIRPASSIGRTERKFEKGDMVNNRLDLLSEFDFVYKEHSGFRVSASAWYDKRYDNDYLTYNGATTANFLLPGGKYPDQTKRYYNGPSGEWLDAFVFHQFNVAGVPVDIKLGQHTVYWGESLFSLGRGVSDGQAPLDLRKALQTPGIEAKELFRPLNQMSVSAAISPELTVFGQYYFDWQPSLFPNGGTYFSFGDFFTYAGATRGGVWQGLYENGVDKNGDFGLGAKWNSELLGGTAGLYYREYTSKTAHSLVAIGPSMTVLPPGSLAFLVDPDADRTKLYGFSLSRSIGSLSFGMDLTYRKDAYLAYKSGLAPTTPTGAAWVGNSGWQPQGNVYTGVFNIVGYDGERSLYDSAVLTAELDFDALEKVTKNFQNFNGRARCVALNGGSRGYYGCATGQAIGVAVKFEPRWFQVLEGVDLSMPMFYTVGLKGNSAVVAVGSNEGMGSYSLGLTANVNNAYEFSLSYAGQLYKRRMLNTGIPQSNASLGDNSDRNRIVFTAKYGF